MSHLSDVLDGIDGEIDVEQIEGIQFEIVGSQLVSKTVLEKLHLAGAKVGRVGPYTDSDMWPKVDVDRFLFTGFLPSRDANTEEGNG